MPRRWKISKAFVLAVLMAAGTVAQDPSNPEHWTAAAGIILAAISGGARKPKDAER